MSPTTDDAANTLDPREICALLWRRRDAAFVCFTLLTMIYDPAYAIRSVERRPSSVQIAFSLRLASYGGEVVYGTQDVPFQELPDDDDALGLFTVTAHGPQEDARLSSEPQRLYALSFFREWRARWAPVPASMPYGDEVMT